MKRLALSLALALGALPALAAPAPVYPPHVVPRTQLRVLPPTPEGRHYQLHVHLPASFAREPQRRYPVLYVTDGYWDFTTFINAYNSKVADRVVPEFIIVGLGYAGDNPDYDMLRRWDLPPMKLPQPGDTGHADKFLATLEHEIIPLVERDYRADPAHRVLAGSSLGGLFTLYAMYTKPALFQGYIAASPAVNVADDWIIRQARAYAATGKPIPARLYVTGAELEWPAYLAGIQRYMALLPELNHPGLVFESRIIDGERHSGTKPESYARGMKFVFAPLAPETGPQKD
ncbi:alpha/beta hydrolase [Roseateles cellulosilyticus]|uniref:Alpha/beta hydrolase n=1 Tax=Pelomonas cellulosilytica TaxID=2906762 RepID=A0ABS8XWV1_9BURK|nr:alpha/beta hydrolase-fold protein [Pelomonas sp. P8]MCE4553755.1 hypothetical protein [Pelomonas sp. P8]